MTIGVLQKDENDLRKIIFTINQLCEGRSNDPTRRTGLSAATSFYIATTGSDSNDGRTAATPFLTLQRAYDVLASQYDLNGQIVTVNVAAGTYTGGIAVATGWVGGGTINFKGDETTPSNVVINTTNTSDINCTGPFSGTLLITGMQLKNSGAGALACITILAPGCLVQFNKIDFNTSSNRYLFVNASGSSIQTVTNGSFTISAGTPTGVDADNGGAIQIRGCTVTLTGTPAFSFAFANVTTTGTFICDFSTFSGAATGTRYIVSGNGVINTGGGGPTFLPGSVAGTTATGGQYL